MDCCNRSAEPAVEAVDCPRCGQRGRTVRDVTLDALLVTPSTRAAGTWRFCKSAGCPVVYFNGDGIELLAAALTVRVGLKEVSGDRPICYCFGHSASDILERPGIREEIKAACKRGEDRCAEMNPQGSCCLGSVAAVLRHGEHEVPA